MVMNKPKNKNLYIGFIKMLACITNSLGIRPISVLLLMKLTKFLIKILTL